MDRETLFKCEKVAINVALAAGNMMKSASGGEQRIEQKLSPVDLVTETDKAVEAFVFNELRKHFPNHKFIGEESATDPTLTNELTWIVDPIDGTMNFVHTFPWVCISMALVYEKEPIIGVIYSPFLEKMYTAKKGFGAYCNGIPLHVSDCESLEKSLILYELGGYRDEKRINAIASNLMSLQEECHGLRSTGSAALNLCTIANGHADGYFQFDLKCWDLAAGALIVSEAGGYVVDITSDRFDLMRGRIVAACNANIAKAVIDKIQVHLKPYI
ncbi:inositol monophosphatase-like protein [Dinothrombium tinctorium]|uniref:Inositol-1-monophosphatase n=1 Tax=Dinothrombium tinctorium TaxID=1965070 RepID=A0A3S3S3J6_9ACAR|nr:inositol monophosphatase-like protein [Dinothrombium tinctorium]RWS09872.1 inositol monophosphatase-like protein [Dinothrombium tinctorium]RWS09949.1 inositol monophosphatase-like protein [Dinothrombium tinctorium]RWS14701.1 inositol monophosphatase-like protein [Dinothrombium tinctorium]